MTQSTTTWLMLFAVMATAITACDPRTDQGKAEGEPRNEGGTSGSGDSSDGGGTTDGGDAAGDGGSAEGGEGGGSTSPSTLTDALTGMVLRRIEAGDFVMGCTAEQAPCQPDYRNRTPVTLTYAYYMGETEVTQAQFEAAMGYAPSRFGTCADCPVEQINWHEAAALANALSSAAGLPLCYTCTGAGAAVDCTEAAALLSCGGYRLPTEAEWEGAARCGQPTRYAGGDEAEAVAWMIDSAEGATQPVGLKSANSCGLFDMSGNVWEWVNDGYDAGYYRASRLIDPTGPASWYNRVMRGGSWNYGQPEARVAFRGIAYPGLRSSILGLRLARTAP